MNAGASLSAPAAAMPPSRQPEHRPITLAMRVALGLAHAGALYREGNSHWRSRGYPDKPVQDQTVQALIQRGLLRLQEYEGLYGVRRACVVVTPEGRIAYHGGSLAAHRPPPVEAEAVLREVEAALATLSAESQQLGREQAAALDAAIEARRNNIMAQATLDRIEKRLAALAASRAALDARRGDLRCLVQEAAERMMGGEDGR
jgi:hypothetical protein